MQLWLESWSSSHYSHFLHSVASLHLCLLHAVSVAFEYFAMSSLHLLTNQIWTLYVGRHASIGTEAHCRRCSRPTAIDRGWCWCCLAVHGRDAAAAAAVGDFDCGSASGISFDGFLLLVGADLKRGMGWSWSGLAKVQEVKPSTDTPDQLLDALGKSVRPRPPSRPTLSRQRELDRRSTQSPRPVTLLVASAHFQTQPTISLISNHTS